MATKQQSGGYNPDLLPNTCQTPNVILDQWMFSLTGAEFKVVMYAVRRTYGFGRKSSRISKSEFVNGTKDRDGNLLDHGTGLGKSTVKDAISSLVEKGILKEKPGLAQSGANATNRYSLNLKYLPEAPQEQTPEEPSEGGQKLAPQGPEIDRGEGPKNDPSGGQKLTPPNTHGNPVGNPVDLPSVDQSSRDTRPRESSPENGETGPTDRQTDGQTEENAPTNEPEASTTATLLEPEEPSHERSNTPILSPKEDEDNTATKPEEALRQQAEAIPLSEVSEEAENFTTKVFERLPLEKLPTLSERDHYRIKRLAEHYQRQNRANVLRSAVSGLATEAYQQHIRSPWAYLIACCVDAEKECPEGDEDLLASLSGENTSSSSEENQPARYEWFFSESEQESKDNETEQRQRTPEPDPEAQEVWEKVLEDVSGEINAPSLRVWFEGTVPISLSEEALTVSVPNSFAREYIESRFKELLEDALGKRLSPTSSLEIVVGVEGSTDNTERRKDR